MGTSQSKKKKSYSFKSSCKMTTIPTTLNLSEPGEKDEKQISLKKCSKKKNSSKKKLSSPKKNSSSKNSSLQQEPIVEPENKEYKKEINIVHTKTCKTPHNTPEKTYTPEKKKTSSKKKKSPKKKKFDIKKQSSITYVSIVSNNIIGDNSHNVTINDVNSLNIINFHIDIKIQVIIQFLIYANKYKQNTIIETESDSVSKKSLIIFKMLNNYDKDIYSRIEFLSSTFWYKLYILKLSQDELKDIFKFISNFVKIAPKVIELANMYLSDTLYRKSINNCILRLNVPFEEGTEKFNLAFHPSSCKYLLSNILFNELSGEHLLCVIFYFCMLKSNMEEFIKCFLYVKK